MVRGRLHRFPNRYRCEHLLFAVHCSWPTPGGIESEQWRTSLSSAPYCHYTTYHPQVLAGKIIGLRQKVRLAREEGSLIFYLLSIRIVPLVPSWMLNLSLPWVSGPFPPSSLCCLLPHSSNTPSCHCCLSWTFPCINSFCQCPLASFLTTLSLCEQAHCLVMYACCCSASSAALLTQPLPPTADSCTPPLMLCPCQHCCSCWQWVRSCWCRHS